MKRIFTIAAALFLTASVWAQAPDKMSYQAVIRDAGNSLVSSTAVGIQISILQGGVAGTAVYVETQTPTTNANGLVSLEIGTGNVISGDFTTIDWANDTYFIKTETDPTGGTSYTITGTSQLLSVPYALHAKTAENVTNDLVDDADADPTNEIELPTGGSNGQVLQTDGSGNYTWVNQTTDTDTQLSETQVDAFVSNNGYVTTSNDADSDPANEIQNLSDVLSTSNDANGNNIINVDSLAIGSSSPTEKLDVSGKIKSSAGYYTISGTIDITGPGVYEIVYGSGYRGIGTMSCSIDQVANGIWNAGGTIVFSENSNTQDYILNVVEYQLYNGGNIDAELRPKNGANYDNVGANIDGRVEVEVYGISGPSVLRWSLTVFPAN